MNEHIILTWKEIAKLLPKDARAMVLCKEKTGMMPRYLIDVEKEQVSVLTPVFTNTNRDPKVTSPWMEVLSVETMDALHAKGYITCREASEMLGVGYGKLVAYHRAGILTFSEVGGVRMAFLRSDVEAMKEFFDKTKVNHA